MKKWCSIILLFCQLAYSQSLLNDDPTTLLSRLSLDEKIGQLFMVAAVSDERLNSNFMEYSPYQMEQEYVAYLITRYHVGGVIFLGSGTISAQRHFTDHFQSLSKIPLLIGQDCEWGLAMRIRDIIKFPYALTLGAIQDNVLIYRTGLMIGVQCAAIGVHINFAPVADVNTNPDNPVIGYRSFGNQVNQVTQKSIAFAHGLTDAGIIACAKHAPGHGDTQLDSHYALPTIAHSRERLQSVELVPFTQLIATGIPALMMAHVTVPALDATRTPASLSYPITTELLRNQLGFQGLLITDGLGMRAVTHNKAPGMVELEALFAGNDILLCPVDVPAACSLIKQALTDGTLSQERLDAQVLKILRAKARIQIQTNASLKDLEKMLHAPEAYALKQQLFDAAITLVRDQENLVPISTSTPIAYLELGAQRPSHFAQLLETSYNVTHTSAETEIPDRLPLIISVHGMSKYARDTYGLNSELIRQIKDIYHRHPRTIVVLFGNPYSVSLFSDAPCIMCGYEDEQEAHEAVYNIISGKKPAVGRLPI